MPSPCRVRHCLGQYYERDESSDHHGFCTNSQCNRSRERKQQAHDTRVARRAGPSERHGRRRSSPTPTAQQMQQLNRMHPAAACSSEPTAEEHADEDEPPEPDADAAALASSLDPGDGWTWVVLEEGRSQLRPMGTTVQLDASSVVRGDRALVQMPGGKFIAVGLRAYRRGTQELSKKRRLRSPSPELRELPTTRHPHPRPIAAESSEGVEADVDDGFFSAVSESASDDASVVRAVETGANQGSCGATSSAATVATTSLHLPPPPSVSSAKPSRWLVGNLSEDETGMNGATPSAATAATLPPEEASEPIDAEQAIATEILKQRRKGNKQQDP